MLRILTASSILALAAVPAIAQQADPMTAPTAPQAPATTTTPAPEPAPHTIPADPVTSAPMAPMAQPAPAAPAPETRETTVQKLVDAEFPSYDGDGDGELTLAEFSRWMLALQSASPNAQTMDDAAKAKWAKDAFATADTDKNKKVSKAELNTFLVG